MSRARHGLYLIIVKALVAHGVRYTLPPYQGMPPWPGGPPSQGPAAPGSMAGFVSSGPAAAEGAPLRPPGEGLSFMPSFAHRAALKL